MAEKEEVRRVPNLRFLGFEGAWQLNKLGDMTSWSSGGTPSKDNPLFWDGDIPWISASSMRGLLYSDSEIKITQEGLTKGSRLAPRGTLLLLVRGSMLFNKIPIGIVSRDVAFNQDVKSIVVSEYSTSEYILNWFLASETKLLNMVTGTGIGAGKLELKELKELDIKIPSLSEQKKITSFLKLISERIETQSKIIEEFELLKVTFVTKIFTRQFRFKNNGNFENWENVTLGDITILVNNRNKENKKLPIYSINNRAGFIPQGEQFDGVDSNVRGYDIKIYKVIDKRTFAYNPARINVGSIGYSGELDKIIVSSLYVCFKTGEKVNDDFLLQYLKTDFFNKQVLENMEGGVRSYLFYENFSRIKLNLPCLEEQGEITSLLSSIDNKITLENTILKKLREQKEYLLSNLFM